ncbi:MAG: imidazole glycerol phosphate synthase subunit HisH [Bacteroidota bacterium]
MIVIIDYGVGNLVSIKNILKKVGINASISNEINVIKDASKLILPGVGSFNYSMQKINENGLNNILNQKVLIEKIPLLGICLGLQLMTKESEEGQLPGLGWINAKTIRFRLNDTKLKIPNMGWNEIIIKKESKLFHDMPQPSRFYFAHSFHLECFDKQDILLTANYGYEFICGIEKDNIVGVQFHPEKSHKYGMKLLYNFCHNF